MNKIKIIVVFIIGLSFLILTTACNSIGSFSEIFFGRNNTSSPISTVSTQSPEDGLQTQNQEQALASAAASVKSPIQTFQPENASSYLPLEKDVHMKYKGTGNEYAGYDTYVQYAKVDLLQLGKSNGGASSSTVYQFKNGAIKKVFTKGDTYCRYDYTTLRNDDEIVLKEPIKVGTSWKLKDGSERSITSVDKQIITPSGNYSAIEVTTKMRDSSEHDYYAMGIGLIKSETLDNSGTVTTTSELEKIEKSVPAIQTIKIYFPQFSKEQVIPVDREIQIRTNEDMKFKFQKELKTVPVGGGFTKVLSDSVQILNVKVDDSTGIVTVDFSSQLVTGMNAGTTLESLILKSITNTFGKYYNKDKVIITIQGKPYESGHILKKKGEYFTVS